MATRTDPYLPTLGNSIAGHLMEAVVQGLVVFVVLLLMRFLAPAHATGVGTLLIMGWLSCAVSGVVVACCERPATVREQHPAPVAGASPSGGSSCHPWSVPSSATSSRRGGPSPAPGRCCWSSAPRRSG